MANPDPEVRPEDIVGDVRIIATGRSDYPNQVNNVLAFPGIFRGALAAQATAINDQMNLAAARAIAAVISEDELFEEYVIPSVFNKSVVEAVAHAVQESAIETGVAQRITAPSPDPTSIYR
jgi:malate dehydrogenase (oxaloacetate-decarboxylating)